MREPTSKEIADWFASEGFWNKIQGPSGFLYLREGTDYTYVWVESNIDFDLEKHYLLDVRVGIGESEVRHFLYVHIDAWDGAVIRYIKFNDEIEYFSKTGHEKRFRNGMKKFVGLVADHHWRERATQ